MDSLKLNMIAVDKVHPLLSDLSSSLNKLTILPPDFEGKTKMKEWIVRLSKMEAADELTEQQARQLHFDLESSYNSFMAALPTAGTCVSMGIIADFVTLDWGGWIVDCLSDTVC
ncbi:vacuolar protein sorting-associated protein-like protein [Actinidia rufa]|uniref:Vacuolar protein sorting-associated protein-like protein n=1 Tax=Actinidia rufa TaxID=165716 RepID=A0A7J0G634_9ERIC|nr:vacuolar protein sorting-associated protein-like protein [Actinidia rufa]